ncbi:iron-sulfur cluster assembly scaffold protein [candidate division WOR-3 bacterium]|nr:iron-sulfur cluster assembly scaffold protein [candidate division WOR-3 bacterium]
MKFPYSEKVLEHFRNPRNVGSIENPDGKSTEGSPACGDMVSVYIKVDEDTKKIKDIKFESYGCASNIATGSIITELAKGKTLEEAKNISWKQASDALGGLPKIKTHCSVLAVDGLRAAIANYEEKHGLIKEKIPTTKEIVLKRLKHVMNPLAGLDLVRTNLITGVKVENGTAEVTVNLPEEHQFANNIREEIVEKLESLWDIDEVIVNFSV